MTRALRILSLTGLLTFAAFGIFNYPLIQVVYLLVGNVVATRFATILIGQTGYALAFTAGVVAVIASAQRRQRGWAAVFVVLLILAVYGVDVVLPVFGASALGSFYAFGYMYIAQAIPAVLLALLVLIYSLIPRPLANAAAATGTRIAAGAPPSRGPDGVVTSGTSAAPAQHLHNPQERPARESHTRQWQRQAKLARCRDLGHLAGTRLRVAAESAFRGRVGSGDT
jgi:hypothetical protein